MKMFTLAGLLFLLMVTSQIFAQSHGDNPNLDQVPQFLREKMNHQPDAPNSTAAVVTIGNWDNYLLGTDFGESNMAENPKQPAWYFTAYNTNAPHDTENGYDWFIHAANFAATMAGDPVVAYDSLGNLFYENMYGNISGCKVMASINNGVTWGPSVTSIAGNDKNWIAADQTSGPFANYVYTTMTNGGPPGNFARSMDHGLTFTSTWAPTTQQIPGMMVAVGPEGNIQGGAVHVVTNSGSSFNSTYTFYVSTDGGATFTQKSAQQFCNTVGSQVGGRNSVQGMRTRPYPMIAADNSYGANRGRMYVVYASNDPPSASGKPDIFCRSSSDDGATWSAAVKVNDDPNTVNNHQWHPAIWCDKETGKLYVMWMDTRDCPTSDSAMIYASYSTDGGQTFAVNQKISNAKMKIDCPTCGGGGTPRYQGDYNGVVSNKRGSMIGWTDFRQGTFQSMTAYFPDFAMALDHSVDTLFSPLDSTIFSVSVPEVKLYTDTVLISTSITPTPTAGTIAISYPSGNSLTSLPGSKPVKFVLTGAVPSGTYMVSFIANGPNGTPAHKRTATIKVMPGNVFKATAIATPGTICQGATSQLNVSILGGTAPFTYSWNPATGLSNPNIINPVATPAATTTYHVTVTDNASHITSDSVIVHVNTGPTTPGPITGLQSICKNTSGTYSIVDVPVATTYSWSVPLDAQITSGQNTTSITVLWGVTSGNVSVIAGNDCGTSVPSVLPVTVNMPPTALIPIHGPDSLCAGTNGTYYTALSDLPVTYTWTVPADASIVSGQHTDTIHVTWGQSAGNVTAVATNDCGSSGVASKAVGVKVKPAVAGTIVGKDTVCQGTNNHIYSIPAIAGATQYVWTLPVGATATAGQGTNQVTLAFSTTAVSGNLSVLGHNSCGDGSGSVKALILNNCTGVNQAAFGSSVQIYPNPVSGELTLTISGKERVLTLSVIDGTGRVQYTEALSDIPANFTRKLDMSRFAKGIYYIRLSHNDHVYSEKVIVQ
ncbi:MAG: T9SS type A sorting domain-containing protein [Bacteroidota bacterium]